MRSEATSLLKLKSYKDYVDPALFFLNKANYKGNR